MMTWFDALLVTMLALIMVLGMQRGVMGLLWGISAALACWLCNLLSGVGAAVAALVVGGALAYGSHLLSSRTQRPDQLPLWEALLGGGGGLLFGLVFILSLSLGFPLRDSPRSYPAAAMPPALYTALKDSAIQTQLRGVWRSKPQLKRLLIPDQVSHKP